MNTWLLGMLCFNATVLPGDSCGPTSEALSRQLGVYQGIEAVQGQVADKARDFVGKQVETALGYGFAAYKLSSGEETKINLKSPILCDRVGISRSKYSGSMTLEWNL